MAKIQFLTILLTVTCFLGGVVSVTDKEFEVSTVPNYYFDRIPKNPCLRTLIVEIEIPLGNGIFKANCSQGIFQVSILKFGIPLLFCH